MTCFGKQRGLYLYNFKMGWSGFPTGILAFAICLYPIPALEGANPNPHPLRRGCAQMRLGRDGRPQLDLPDIPRAINATFGKFTEAWLEGRGRKSPLQISIVQSLIEESLPKLALIDAYGALASEVVAASKIWGGIVQNATMEYFRDSMAGYQPALTPPPILGRNESLDHHEIPMERNSRSAREPEPTQPTEEQAEYGFHPPEMEDFNISKRVELLQKLAYYGVLFFTTEEEQTIDEHLESGSRVALFEHFLNSLLQAQISDVIMHAVGSGEMGVDGDRSLPDNGDFKGLSNNTDMGGRGGEVLTRYLTGENYSALYGAYGTVSFNVTGGLEFESLLKTLRGQVDEWIGQDNPQLPALYNVNCWAGEDRSVGCKVCPQKEMSRNATIALDSLATRLTVPFSLLGIDLEEVSGGIGRRYRRWIAQMRTRVPTTDGTDDETPDRGEDVTQDPGDGETPDDGGENPDTGGENPVTTGENPDTGGENPDTGGENPDTGGENPDTGGENPDTGGENPDTGGENPDTGGENPDTGGENPDTGGENPDTGGENPDTGGENPDTGGENPDTGGENPDTGGENPDTGGENPDTGGENPDTGGENPVTARENPDTGVENPVTVGENPVTVGENPDTGGENPDTGGENPDTGGENPDTGVENPDTGGENPVTVGENPDTGGENPDTGGENPDTGGENPDTGGENPDMGDGNPDGQEEVPRVVAAITGPKEIPSCGDLVLHGSASQGPSLSYTWEMSPRQQTSEALMARLKTVNDANEPYLKLNGGLLTEGVEYTVTLTVSPQGSRHSHSISHRVRRLSEASKKPSLVLQHRGLSENNNILASKTLLLWADVHFYDSCIESSSVKFVWSARQGSQPPITGLLQRGGRNQRIPAGQLPVGEPVTISVEIPPNGETVLESVTAEVTVTVERSPLIVSIKGGSEITAGTDSQANLVLDASESQDPDDEEARLDFSWTCRLTNPAKSECPGQLSPSDRSTLSVTLNNTWDDPNPYVFTVTVRRRQRGAGHATASVIVHVKRGDPPQIELSAPFQGKFQPSRDVVVTAQISNAALGSSVEWLVLKGGVQQTVQGATSTSVSRGTAIRASFAIPKGMLAAGSDYTVKANVKDFPGQVASSASTTITVFKGVSGCTVQLQSQEYRVFEIVDISVIGCTGTGKLTYKAFVAPTADSEERQVLTTVASEQSRLNQDRAVKVAGAATVAIIVRVEDETGSWAEFAKSDVPQVEEPTAGGIEAVKNTREKLVQTGDYVGALHQNGMLVKYSRGDSKGATRRRRGVYDEARNLHRAFFHNATADFPNLDISQWDSVAFELDSFYTEDKESKDDVLNNIQTMLESYLTIRPEEFDTGARDSILRKIGEVLMDLSPDTAEARALIHRCRRMIRTVMSHVGQGLAEGDRITTRTGRSSVHIRRLTLRADQLIEAGRTKLKFPESLEQIGRSMTLNVEEYDDAEDLNSENGKKQPLSGPIRSISLMDADGNPYSISGLTDPIEITFSAVDGKHVCLYYDEMDKAWSRKGLTTRQERPGAEIVCQTLHLTDFATAVDVNKGPEVPVGGLTVAAVVGIIVGVLALLVIVLLIVFLVVKVNKNKKVNPKD